MHHVAELYLPALSDIFNKTWFHAYICSKFDSSWGGTENLRLRLNINLEHRNAKHVRIYLAIVTLYIFFTWNKFFYH